MTMKKSSSSIQAIYDLCKHTFTPSATSPVSSHAIQKLSSLLVIVLLFISSLGLPVSLSQVDCNLCWCVGKVKHAYLADTIGPVDVGLSDASKEDNRGLGPFGIFSFNRVDRWVQPLTYVDIHEGENFTMCIFCFPTSSVIPLHDHPGMTVLSKVLYGSLHVKAYDWAEPACIQKTKVADHSEVRLAKLAVDKVLNSSCSTNVLYPRSGGNLHCFTALTPCAILDILAPPYNEFAGRRCSYYRDYPCSSISLEDNETYTAKNEEDYAWLAEVDAPDDLCMRSGTYTGPAIQK